MKLSHMSERERGKLLKYLTEKIRAKNKTLLKHYSLYNFLSFEISEKENLEE